MNKFWFLSFIVLAFSCSDSDEPGCSSDLTSIQLDITVVYTGEIITFAKPTLCSLDQLTILVNEKEAPLTLGYNGEISFTVPANSESSATIIVRAGGSEKSFGPVPVINAYGTWKAVAPFTGPGRSYMADFATATDGYLFGGSSHIGQTHTDYDDLYKYNADGNAWTKVAIHDNFKQYTEAFLDNNLYFYKSKYSVTDNVFTPVSGLTGKGMDFQDWETQYFTCKGNVYAISDINSNSIEIQKYNPGEDTWSVVQDLPYLDYGEWNYFWFNFAIEHNGITYIGILFQNHGDIDVWAFDGAANSFTKVSRVSNNINGSTRDLKHLFTINDLAYFIERGESSMDSDGKVQIIKARNYFYVYNFATNEWHKVKTEFPESMYGISSFNIGNRGFAGLGAKEGTIGFVYSQQFFEFVLE